jgi:hypothetical protein
MNRLFLLVAAFALAFASCKSEKGANREPTHIEQEEEKAREGELPATIAPENSGGPTPKTGSDMDSEDSDDDDDDDENVGPGKTVPTAAVPDIADEPTDPKKKKKKKKKKRDGKMPGGDDSNENPEEEVPTE